MHALNAQMAANQAAAAIHKANQSAMSHGMGNDPPHHHHHGTNTMSGMIMANNNNNNHGVLAAVQEHHAFFYDTMNLFHLRDVSSAPAESRGSISGWQQHCNAPQQHDNTIISRTSKAMR